MDVKYSLAVEVGDDSGAAEETENELTWSETPVAISESWNLRVDVYETDLSALSLENNAEKACVSV